MYIACDIGGTKFRIAGSKDLKNFTEPVIKDTPDSPEEGLKEIAETIKEIVNQPNYKDEKLEAVVFGIAGVLNADHSELIRSPHLPAWEKVPLKEILGKTIFEINPEAKIYIENDTDIVGLGEAVDGAGKGFEIVVYITVSTGIGGVKVVNGKFEKNRFGFEPGHQILNNQSEKNWEELASGTAVEARYGKHPKEVAQTEAWAEVEHNIAVGLHNSILHWSPDVVVVGGSMAKDLDADRLKKGIKDLMKIHPEVPEIKIAKLGSIGGIHGGFAFLKGLK
jgi:predicted NBD/HSP70 family sugar kinase